MYLLDLYPGLTILPARPCRLWAGFGLVSDDDGDEDDGKDQVFVVFVSAK